MARCRIGAGEGEGVGGARDPGGDHRDQEDYRTHHQEQLPMQQNTGHKYILSECTKRIMYIMCILVLMNIIIYQKLVE